MKKGNLIIESEITNALLTAGIPANLQGFHFLKDAITESIKQPNLLQQLTKRLYPDVGKKHGVTSAIVERSIRSAIDNSFKNNGLYGLNEMLSSQYFNGTEKPCNGCFIALLSEIVKKNMYQFVARLDEKSSPEQAQLLKEIEESIGNYSKNSVII